MSTTPDPRWQTPELSDTPRTDTAIALIDEHGELVRAEVSRWIERDLKAMTAARDYEKAAHKRAVESCHADIKALMAENEKLQAEVERLRNALNLIAMSSLSSEYAKGRAAIALQGE
jgi:hypothetical protein